MALGMRWPHQRTKKRWVGLGVISDNLIDIGWATPKQSAQ
jgi:hypothetical protein